MTSLDQVVGEFRKYRAVTSTRTRTVITRVRGAAALPIARFILPMIRIIVFMTLSLNEAVCQ